MNSVSITPETPGQPERKAEVAALSSKINELGSEFLTAQEWGIFAQEKTVDSLETEIIAQLEKGREECEAGRVPFAQTALLRAKSSLSRAQERYWWYRLNNQYGLLPVVFTAFSVLLAYFAITAWIQFLPDHVAAAHAALLGLLGAGLRALYWLQFQLGKGQLRPRLMVVFAVAPFIGALLGVVSFLIVVVGFKLGGTGAGAKPDALAISLFAAFSGYNWEWALEKFLVAADALAAKFASRSGPSGKPGVGAR